MEHKNPLWELIDCEYVNLPVDPESTASRQVSRRHLQHVRSILAIQAPMSLEIAKGYDQHVISFLTKGLQEMPSAFAHNMKTLFIHSGIYEVSEALATIQDAHSLCRLHMLFDQGMMDPGLLVRIFQRKTGQYHRQVANAENFEELLASVQALLILQCMLLLDDDGTTPEPYSDTTATMITNVAEQLWQQAPIQLPSTLSPRHAWLFAESVRQTIIVGFMLRSVYSLKKRNYSVRTPFVDSLPFDMRTSLWTEDSEEAWDGAATDSSESMISLHQYSSMLEAGRVHDISPFGRLILAACKGKLTSEILFPAILPDQ